MNNSVNAISAMTTMAGTDTQGHQVWTVTHPPTNTTESSSDTVTISPAGRDLARAFQGQNSADALQSANTTSTSESLVGEQSATQLTKNTNEQTSDTTRLSEAASDSERALQARIDHTYAQQLADDANLAASETAAGRNRETASAVYNMASANSFRPRRIRPEEIEV